MTSLKLKSGLNALKPRRLNLSDGNKSQRFAHEVGSHGNDPMNLYLTKTKRALTSKIFQGTDHQIRVKRNKNSRFKNMGRFLQNQLSYSPSQFYNGKSVPFPQTSIHSITMNNAYTLMNVCDFFVVSSYQNTDQFTLSKIKTACQDAKVSFLILKPIMLQACLWKLFSQSPNRSLDDFWIDAQWESYSDGLFNKLKSPKVISNKVGIYFFSLNPESFSDIDLVFPVSHLESQTLLGAHFLPKVVGGPERLRLTLKNINTPWKDDGDMQTMGFAKVLKEFASKGLVKSSKALNGGLTVLSADEDVNV